MKITLFLALLTQYFITDPAHIGCSPPNHHVEVCSWIQPELYDTTPSTCYNNIEYWWLVESMEQMRYIIFAG